MNKNFEQCKSGHDLPISEELIFEWVKSYYSEFKGSKYCITKSNDNFLIFPIEEMNKYFSFSAKYRIKKSGSSTPSLMNKSEIEEALQSINISASINFDNSICTASFDHNNDRFIIKGKNYKYQFTRNDSNFIVRRLSNTNNANFIVSIRLRKFNQEETDLNAFEQDLIK